VGGLHSVNEIIADALIAKRDQVARLNPLLDAIRANVGGDHFFAHTPLSHGHDIGSGDRATVGSGKLSVGDSVAAIGRVSDLRAGEHSEGAAEQRSFHAMSAPFADQSASTGSGQSANASTAIGVAGAASEEETNSASNPGASHGAMILHPELSGAG
jgi:hypothetical protein